MSKRTKAQVTVDRLVAMSPIEMRELARQLLRHELGNIVVHAFEAALESEQMKQSELFSIPKTMDEIAESVFPEKKP